MHNHGEGLYFDLKPEWVERIAKSRIKNLAPRHYSMNGSEQDSRLYQKAESLIG